MFLDLLCLFFNDVLQKQNSVRPILIRFLAFFKDPSFDIFISGRQEMMNIEPSIGECV